MDQNDFDLIWIFFVELMVKYIHSRQIRCMYVINDLREIELSFAFKSLGLNVFRIK